MQSWFRYDGDRLILATYDRDRPLTEFTLAQRLRATNVWKPRELFVTVILALIIAYFIARTSLPFHLDPRLQTALAIGVGFVFARGGLSIALSIVEWIYGPTFSSIHPEPIIGESLLDAD
jgi:hypothetical protein